VGKTRLALEAAADAAEGFPGGVWFVPLASVTAPSLVAATIEQVIGVRAVGQKAPTDALASFFRERAALLLLDNFEHVIEAAPLVTDLLAACPRLTCVVTSQMRLRVAGERHYLVSPLALPPPNGSTSLDTVIGSSSVALFAERALAVKPDFVLSEGNAPAMAEICRRLDGLPLAIELAAAWVQVLPPAALLARLGQWLPLLTGGGRDAPARLQTMRNAIAWSYDLLGIAEQRLLQRLSVFVGGFTWEAAEAVVPLLDGGRIDVLEGVASLVDKSLLQVAVELEEHERDPRYLMLETVREFGLERLGASGEEEQIRRRHATFINGLLAEHTPPRHGADEAKWLDRLAIELPNVRAALAWTVEHGSAESAQRLVTYLGPFWYTRGDPREGDRWIGAALARGGGGPARADALFHASMLASLRDSQTASALAQEGLTVARVHGYAFGMARSLLVLGIAAEWAGDFDRAIALEEEALVLLRNLDEPFWTAMVLVNLADASLWRGDLSRAQVFAEEGLILSRAVGNEFGLALALGPVAVAATERGDLTRAAQLYEERLSHWMALGDRLGIGGTLAGLAGVAMARGQPKRAARLLGTAYALRDTLGVAHLHHHVRGERVLAATRASLDVEAFAAAWVAGRVLPIEEAIADGVAMAVEGQPVPTTGSKARGVHSTALTRRERDVLRLLTERRSDREIAAALFVGPRTVETHVAHLFAKIGAKNRAEAAALAVRRDLV